MRILLTRRATFLHTSRAATDGTASSRSSIEALELHSYTSIHLGASMHREPVHIYRPTHVVLASTTDPFRAVVGDIRFLHSDTKTVRDDVATMAIASSTRAFMAIKTIQDARVLPVEKKARIRRRRVIVASHRAMQDASKQSTDVQAQLHVSPKDNVSWNRRTWMNASSVAWCVGWQTWTMNGVAMEPTPMRREEETATCQVKRVFVAGSTGQSGQRIVRQLQQRGIQVRAGARNVKKANQILSNATEEGGGVEVVQADVTWEMERLRQAIGEVDAVVCATGFRPSPDINGVFKVENLGTKNLVDASKAAGVCKFVLISSLLTNAPLVGQKDNPNYKFLNYFGGVLDQKKEAEDYLRASGLNYTIVRAGGLTNDPSYSSGLFVSPEDTLFGLEQEPGREICRDLLASICIEALFQSKATNKVVEVVATGGADPPRQKWFDV